MLELSKQDLSKLLRTDLVAFNKYREDTNYSKISLSRLDLSHMDLRGADFRNTDFSRTDLSYSDLRGCKTQDIILEKTILRDIKY